MGDLRDQMKKAGLLSDKRARKLEREARQREHDRVKASKAGDAEQLAALETEQERLRKEREAEEAARRQAEAERIEAERAARQHEERVRQMHALIDSNRVAPGPRDQTWRFVASDGKVESLSVSDTVAERLSHSELTIVERPEEGAPADSHRFVIVPTAAALRLEELYPLAIRFSSAFDRREGPAVAKPQKAEEPAEPEFDENDFLAGLD